MMKSQEYEEAYKKGYEEGYEDGCDDAKKKLEEGEAEYRRSRNSHGRYV
jgi:flagellar biosynthesis/type III secretory pathway protein FliH